MIAGTTHTDFDEESSVFSSSYSISSKVEKQSPKIKSRRSLEYLASIAIFSAIIVYFDGVNINSAMFDPVKSPSNGYRRRALSVVPDQGSGEGNKRVSLSVADNNRVMEVVDKTWSECVNQHMNGIACKTFIDEEILNKFEGDDRMTRTILVEKRSILDVFYNSVVIPMDDSDIVQGRDGDGLVYYDFLWEGSGEAATDEACSETPPVIATEDKDGTMTFEEEPVLVEGDGCDVKAAPDKTRPKVGGVVIDPETPNCGEDDDAELARRIDEALALDIPAKGERKFPAFDCSCLSGYSCCLLIKATIRDADVYNKAIQCHLNFSEGTEKHEKFETGRGKHVNIYTNHNFLVSIAPKVEGSWYDPAENTTAPTTATA